MNTLRFVLDTDHALCSGRASLAPRLGGLMPYRLHMFPIGEWGEAQKIELHDYSCLLISESRARHVQQQCVQFHKL